MFENYLDWAISSQVPLKWERFNDYLETEYTQVGGSGATLEIMKI